MSDDSVPSPTAPDIGPDRDSGVAPSEHRIALPCALDSIRHLEAFVARSFLELALPERLRHGFTLALEELLANSAHHGGAGRRDEISIRVWREPGLVCVEYADHGTAFDPLSLPDPVLEGDSDRRKVGGLGVYLIRTLMSEVVYQRAENRNIILMRKHLEAL